MKHNTLNETSKGVIIDFGTRIMQSFPMLTEDMQIPIGI